MMNQLTETIEKNGNVKVCFGEPYEKDSLTIIPVAKMKAGGGGGTGTANGSGKTKDNGKNDPEDLSTTTPPSTPSNASGSGMGIGITTTPVGYIQIKNGNAEYKEIIDHEKIALYSMVTSLLSIFFVSVSVVRIFKLIQRITTKKRKNESVKL